MLSWNEIKDRALQFSQEWANEKRERAEKDSFWNDFFHVFGISRRRVATFEKPVRKLNDKTGFIDLFWKGTLLAEHKSKGKNLDAAFQQATDYFHGIPEHELPKYVLVSDFANLRLYDLDNQTQHQFPLAEFYQHVKLFGFIAGYQTRTFQEQDPVNIHAAELMGKLHDELKTFDYKGHQLELYLVRLLFILFADDTSIFERNLFKDYVELKTRPDGSDLGALLAQFFQVLNTPSEQRLKNLDEALAQFPYVNGKLFEEPLPIAAFNSQMRTILLQAAALDWGKISPAIFGSLFQSVMNPAERRHLGAHYTSGKNILKLIQPLFLDDLRTEFERVKNSTPKLKAFHQKLSQLRFLDPACGSGNFLIVSYRELRLLEIEVLKRLYPDDQFLDIASILKVQIDQFYGLEYDEFAARVAEVAMWLIDHQMNMKVSEAFGRYFVRLPLDRAATVVQGNALQMDWEDVISKTDLSYMIGNPPFVGSKLLDKTQRADMATLFQGVRNGKILDYVAAWYYKAARYMQGTAIKTAFVATNSITQGEQVSVLWGLLMKDYKIKIHFAHTTFKWHNEARGKAAVYCVIIGFAPFDTKLKRLFTYADVKGEPTEKQVKNINSYLTPAQDPTIYRQSKPICDVPPMVFGNMPLDGGHLIIEDEAKAEFLQNEPKAEKYIRQLIGAKEFLNNKKRWCLWLEGISPKELRSMPSVLKRVEGVKNFRLSSKRGATRNKASIPTLFGENRQPTNNFIVVPRVSSENRQYIPMAFFDSKKIISDSMLFIPDAIHYHFGILMSAMHMAWVKYTCGRLESRFRYSKDIVYNNFPWPKEPLSKNVKQVAAKAGRVLAVREQFPEGSLADLYDPLAMPPDLVKAHQQLDKVVDLCYRPQGFTDEQARIGFLFETYERYVSPLLGKKKVKKRRKGKIE